MAKQFERIGILGAGLMGHGLAQVFAAKGLQVTVFDHNPKHLGQLPDRVRRNLELLARLNRITEGDAGATLERIRLADSLAAMCRGRQVVIEAISENLAAKRQAFAAMERHAAPETLLASNTSAIRIGDIARGMRHPGRMLGTHFWNPPHIVPCVEVIKGPETSDEVFEAVFGWLASLGKVPVKVLKDLPGFLVG